MNVNVLETILTSECEYWLLRKENKNNCNDELQPSIIMVVIPYRINSGKKRNDIKLIDLEELESIDLNGNIYLNQPYAPFQANVRLFNVTDAYPISCSQRDFLIESLHMDSDDIWKYKELIDKLSASEMDQNKPKE